MKNQNKILLSLVTASIGALAAAPYLEKKSSDEGKDEKKEKSLIELGFSKTEASTNEEEVLTIKEAVAGVLQKKSPVVNLGKHIQVVTENYGNGQSIHQEVMVELGAGFDSRNNQDSTTPGNPTGYTGSTDVTSTQSQVYMCHSACHGVCHSNCHGARGWR